jgi:predicted nucleic acid-binding Zn ribbon protein
MSEEPLKRCPKCRCKVKRLIGSGAGIIFKGSGFYETDYRSKSYSEAKKRDESSVSSSSASSKKSSKPKKTAKKDK